MKELFSKIKSAKPNVKFYSEFAPENMGDIRALTIEGEEPLLFVDSVCKGAPQMQRLLEDGKGDNVLIKCDGATLKAPRFIT